mmetsp:Transcript_39832/g.59084  ORF Transcript_39832/g.59084 Transcript_39832/m.59084 type:complete len:150 (+) Transcript_39832:2355-2804(+)
MSGNHNVPLALVGRFKQTNGALKVYIQPLALRTSSGIEIEKWMARTLREYELVGVKTGPMFRTAGKRGKVSRSTVSALDALFHDILRRVQHRRPDLIASDVKVEDVLALDGRREEESRQKHRTARFLESSSRLTTVGRSICVPEGCCQV